MNCEVGEFCFVRPCAVVSPASRKTSSDCAKSAGTLISLAAQSIVMSDTSELGPVDPQIVTTSPDGSQTSRPAQSYIDAYNDMIAQIEQGVTGPAIDALIAKFDPVLLDMCRKACLRSRRFAEKFLRTGMFRGATANITEIAGKLDSRENWLSHGAVIDVEDAQTIGLNVDYRDEHENEWQAYWRLYLEMRLSLNSNTEKLFESDYGSLQL